jgi:hypothetical protein
MKKLALILLSTIAGWLLGRYYPLVPKKLLLDYLLAAYMAFGLSKLADNDVGNLIAVQEKFQ